MIIAQKNKSNNSGLYIIRVTNLLFVSIILILISTPSYARRSITLPHIEHFNQADSIKDLSWTTQGGTVTWDATAGWNGSGGVKLTPTLYAQGYAALGGFDGFPPQTQLNIRFLMKVSKTFFTETMFNKIIVMHRKKQERWMRPMMMQNGRYDENGVLQMYFTVSQAVTNPTGPFDPDHEKIDPTKYFTIGKNGYNTEIWASYEFEVNLNTGRINLYIYSEDGRFGGLYATLDMKKREPNPAEHPLTEIACLGCFWNRPGEEPPFVMPPFSKDTYVVIDEVEIDNKYIGPPNDFVKKHQELSN